MKNRQPIAALVVGLILIGSSAVLLAHLQSRQRLGKPGVLVVNEEMQGIDRTSSETNKLFLAGTNMVKLPDRVLDYESEIMPVDKVVYDWLPQDTTYGQRLYRARDGFNLMNLVVLMGTDRTSIHKPQYCLQGTGWKIESSEVVKVTMDRPHRYELPAMKLRLTRAVNAGDGRATQQKGVFLYWFVADGAVTGDHHEQMWSLARHLVLRGELQRWAYVICFAAFPPEMEAEALSRVEKFMRASVPEYQLAAGPPLEKK